MAVVDLAGSVLVAAAVFSAACLLGLRLIPRRWAARPPGLRLAQALSAGLTVLSLSLWIAGHVIGVPALAVVAFAYALLGTSRVRLGLRLASLALRSAGRTLRRAPLTAGIALVPILVILPAVTLPVVDSDGLRYHLALPKLFLLEGQIFLYPWDVTGAYPQAAEMLNLLAVGVGHPHAAKTMHFGMFLANLGLLVAATRRPGRPSWPAWCSAGLYAASPVVLAGAGAAFIDQYVVFHCAVALLLAARGGRAASVGLALAGAGWVKWAAGPAMVGLLAVAAVQRRSARWLAVCVVPIALVLAPLILRNFLQTGDPVYPVGTGLVTGGVVAVDERLLESEVTQRHRHIPGPLGLPWGTALGEVPRDEVVGWVHLIGLALAPLVLGDRRAWLAAAMIIPYLAVGLVYHPSVRLAMPLIWGLAALEGQLLWRLNRRWVALAALGFAVLQTPLATSVTARDAWRYLSGADTRSDVLRARVVGWEAAEAVNASSVPGRVLALDYPAPFLFDRPWLAEGLVNRTILDIWLKDCATEEEFRAKFAEHQVRLLVVTPAFGGGSLSLLETLATGVEQRVWIRRLVDGSRIVHESAKVTVLALPPPSGHASRDEQLHRVY